MTALEELLEPIDEERPGGEDVFYGDDFAELTALRELKDSSQERNPTPDYDGMVDVATKILEGQSKDIRVALYLAEALLHTEGFQGFHSGLELVHQMLIRFPEAAHPQDAEDRAYALDFLAGALQADSRQMPEIVRAVHLYPLTDWGHHVHHYEQWKGLDSKDGEEGGDSDEPTPQNFTKGFLATGKAYYKELKAGLPACIAALETLEAWGKEYFDGAVNPKDTPIPRYSRLLGELKKVDDAVQDLLDRKLVDDPDPIVQTASPADEGVPAESGGAAAPAAGSAAAPAAPAGLSPDPKDAGDAARRIAAAARFLRREAPTEPAPYLLLRAFRWGELRAGDGLNVRLLEAPDTSLRTRLKTLLLNDDWEALLDACEEVMSGPCGRGWLDLQRYAMTALENLGGAYRPVTDAVRGQLSALLADLPELLDKTLMDDTPTANAETREWLGLAGITGDASGREGKSSPGTPDYDQERLLSEATYEKALEWVASGNPNRGIQLLKKRADHEQSQRARFITESLAASVMVDAGMLAVARPMLEDLVQLINSRKLEEWESAEVVARPLALLYRCLEPNDRGRPALYDQICRLDPVQAINLDQNRSGDRKTNTAPNQPRQSSEPTESPEEGEAVDTGSSDSEQGAVSET